MGCWLGVVGAQWQRVGCAYSRLRLEDLLDDGGLEVVGELLERGLLATKVGLLPEGRHVVGVGGLDGIEHGFDEVTASAGRATRRGEAVLNAGVAEHLLGDLTRDEAGTARGRDEAHTDRAALARDLARDGVRVADLVPPV